MQKFNIKFFYRTWPWPEDTGMSQDGAYKNFGLKSFTIPNMK